MSFGLAWKSFWRVWRDPEFAKRVEELDVPAVAIDPEVEKRRILGEQLRILGFLQRDGRLLDFLSEDLNAYSDEQIGGAVRDIHRDCKSAIDRHLRLSPVIDQEEDNVVTVPAGFDPSRIRLSGSVKGNAPYRGRLIHRGWQVDHSDLPDRAEGGDARVLAPAEVEIE